MALTHAGHFSNFLRLRAAIILGENIIDALGKTVNTTIANVDTSAVLGEARKEYAAARGAVEEKGKTAVGGLKGLFGK